MKVISQEKTILDVGGGERFQKWLKPYKNLFKDTDYKTLDYDSNSGADIIGDIHHIPLQDGSIDAIICSSVLEHVKNPLKAMDEMWRILKKDGKIFVYVPSIYPYHARKGVYKDYWRFFDDTVKMLFDGFKNVEIKKRGGYFTALSFFFPMQHKVQFFLAPVSKFLDRLFKTEYKTTTAGYYIYAEKK